MKVAVVLYNLGGPCCSIGIEPFLYHLFSDKAIINLPNPFRKWLAKLISSRRTPKANGIYAKLGGRSPILEQTYAQAKALEQALEGQSKSFSVFTYMRYSYPTVDDVIDQLELYKPDKIVLVSLYPQYSTTTTTSSETLWQQRVKERGMRAPTSYVSSYPQHPLFASAYAQLLKDTLQQCVHPNPVVLFSAHGIPLNRIKAGDPYEQHVHQSVQAILQAINIPDLEHRICYQSKVGPLRWLDPSTEHLIEQYAKDRRAIIVLPVAFVSEHSETLVELDIEYQELALAHGVAQYLRVQTVGVHPLYIQCLKELVLEALA
jgi:ferrochelatase